MLAIGLSVLYAIYALYVKFFVGSPQGFTAIIIVMTFLSGMNLFFMGVIGEYVGRVYEETKARPHYVIGKIIGRQGAHSEHSAFSTSLVSQQAPLNGDQWNS